MTHLSTACIHADDIHNRVTDVAPPINVSTTFRYDNENLVPEVEIENFIETIEQTPVYSRESHPNSFRLQTVLSDILGGHAAVYNSGVSAFHALIFHYNPKRFFMDDGYSGVRGIATLYQEKHGLETYKLHQIEEFAEKGDLIHLEVPLNPYGTCRDIAALAKRVHKKGAILSIDSTLAPPPLQDAWDFGADVVMHSATKYLGGHSDLLAGVVVVKTMEQQRKLIRERIFLGTNVGNLESFLLLRSLRTFEMRVLKQSENATKIVSFLHENKANYSKVLNEVYHSSLQKEAFVQRQLAGGHGAVFSVTLRSVEQCKKLPAKLVYFQHATSLGGVESLIEWRALSDTKIDPCLVRLSIGCENADDLIQDLDNALNALQGAAKD